MDYDWQAAAAEAISKGYVPGGEWEQLLRKSLKRSNPKLLRELGDRADAYLQVKTAAAVTRYNRMVEQGTPPDMAEELARAELLGTSD